MATSTSTPPPALPSDEDDSLQAIVARSGRQIDVGTAVLPKPLFFSEDSSTYSSIIKQEFNAIVVEHHLKWAPLCHSLPGPLLDEVPSNRVGRYDFHHADSIVDWALENNIKVKGHVLCWHVTTPDFCQAMDGDELREQLKRHIYTVMGHYRGRIGVWDVVNESLAPDGTLANNIFLEKLGPTYIEECFRWAHEADPTAMLLYNDNKVEGIGNDKSDGFYRLLKDLVIDKHVPIHGCGMQGHFNAAGTGWNRAPTPRMVKEQIARLGELGLKVNLSEVDVRVSKLPSPELRAPAQKQIYHDLLVACLSEPAFDGIWFWGFTDRHTWVKHFYYDDEPLLWDSDYQRKDAYYGVRDALLTSCGGTNQSGVPLESDIDRDGKPWGHAWMQPEPDSYPDHVPRGDARPDWEQQQKSEA